MDEYILLAPLPMVFSFRSLLFCDAKCKRLKIENKLFTAKKKKKKKKKKQLQLLSF